VQRFRSGLVFKAHRLLYHSTLGLRVINKKKNDTRQPMRLKWRRGHRGALQLLLKAAFNASMCVPGPVRGNNTLATKVSALESGLFPSPVAKREWRPTLVQEAKGPPAGEKQTRSQLRLWRRREDLLPRHRDALQLLLDFLDVDHWGVSRGLVERVEHQVVSEHDYRHQHLHPPSEERH